MRALGAIVAQGAQAAVSFALQIIVARMLGIDELGRFAVFYGVLVLATAIVTGLVGDSLVVLDRADARVRGGLAVMLAIAVVSLSVLAAFVSAATGFASPLEAALFGGAVLAFAVEEVVRRLLMTQMRFLRVALIDLIAFAVALGAIIVMRSSLSLAVVLGGIVAGQLLAAVIGWFLLPRAERAPMRLRGADVRAVWRYGAWRALQQTLRPALFTAVRLLVLVALGTAAVGLFDAARTYTSPVMLIVSGMSSFLFVRFAQHAKSSTGAASLAVADRAVGLLILIALVLSAAAWAVSPWAGELLFGVHLDPIAVMSWAVYGTSVALVTPYGALTAVTAKQGVVFLVRLIDTLLGLLGVVVLLLLGVDEGWLPLALAATSALGGIALRIIAHRTAGAKSASTAPHQHAHANG